MKRFSFSLDRVLNWRRLLRDKEKAVLERLAAEHAAIVSEQTNLSRERLNTERALATGLHLDGAEISTLAAWQSSVRKSLAALSNRQKLAQDRIVKQREVLRNAERDLQLLEKLRGRKLSEWTIAASKEEEDFAAEAFLAKAVRMKYK